MGKMEEIASRLLPLADAIKNAVSVDEVETMAESVKTFGKLMTKITRKEGRKKSDGSIVTAADMLTEKLLIRVVQKIWPSIAIMSEEANPTMPREKTFFSIDPLDGTQDYRDGGVNWSVSVGCLQEGEPIAGIVTQPMKGRTYFAMRRGGVFENIGFAWMSGVEKATNAEHALASDIITERTPRAYRDQIAVLSKTFGAPTAYFPAVAAGIEVMLGRSRAWLSHTVCHWDMAAIALFIKEMGGVAECLDGSPMPWDRIRMPPVLLAASQEDAGQVRDALKIKVL